MVRLFVRTTLLSRSTIRIVGSILTCGLRIGIDVQLEPGGLQPRRLFDAH